MTRFIALEHVQLDMPCESEAAARTFYTGVLGLREIPKPAPLGATGAWFATGVGQLHLSAVPGARPALEGHAAMRVEGLAELAVRCEAAGYAVEHDHRYPGRSRFYVRDPFGNNLELFELDENAGAAAVREQPVLHTARLALRPFRLSDAPDVQRLAGVPDVAMTTMNIPHPYPDDLAEAWIATHAPAWAAGELASFAVVDRETDALRGASGLVISPRNASAELGYWIALPHWGRGLATEAADALLDFAFGALKLHRVQARHFTRNPASGRVMQKLGMTLEGVHRESMRRSDRFEDVAMYAILASERSRRSSP